jgi:aminopeptidase N
VADLTLDEAIDRARIVEVESYDIFLDLTAEPVLSRTEVRFRWRRPDASTFAELRTPGVRGVTLDGVRLPPPQDGRLRLSRVRRAGRDRRGQRIAVVDRIRLHGQAAGLRGG